MPRKRRISKIRRTLTIPDVSYIRHGRNWFGSGMSEEEARMHWKTLRAELIAEHITKRPFSRPGGFWKWELRVWLRPADEKEYLIEHNLLSDGEKKLLSNEIHKHLNNGQEERKNGHVEQ